MSKWERPRVREAELAREAVDLTASLAKSASLTEILVPDWIRQICQRGRGAREAAFIKFLTFDSNSTSVSFKPLHLHMST